MKESSFFSDKRLLDETLDHQPYSTSELKKDSSKLRKRDGSSLKTLNGIRNILKNCHTRMEEGL